jgi:hypothetical protein
VRTLTGQTATKKPKFAGKSKTKKIIVNGTTPPQADGVCRIEIDSIVDFSVAAGILGSSLLGMVR